MKDQLAEDLNGQKNSPLPWPSGELRPMSKASPLPWPSGELRLMIKASPEDWRTLYTLSLATPELLGLLIFKYIAEPVYERFLVREDHPLPRGVHAEPQDAENPYSLGARKIFMWNARCYVAAAYTVIMDWLNQPEGDWPEYLRDLERDAKSSNPRSGESKVIEIVMLSFYKKFNKQLRFLGFKKYNERKDFRKVYLLPEFCERAENIFDDRKSLGEMLTIDELYSLMI